MERSKHTSGPPVRPLVPRVSSALVFVALVLVVAVGVLGSQTRSAAQPRLQQSAVQPDLAKFKSLADADFSSHGDIADLTPDLTLLVEEPSQIGDEWLLDVRDRLLAVSGVESVSFDILDADNTVFHLWLDTTVRTGRSIDDLALTVVSETTLALPGDNPLTVRSIQLGGRALSDDAIIGRFDATVTWLAVLAAVVAGLVGWRLGWRRGAVLLVAWIGSVLFAGQIGQRVTAPFDGTIATSPVLPALAGLALALVVGLRLLRWYETPGDGDGASMIQQSLVETASDAALVLGGFVTVIGLLWIVGSPTSALVAVTVGALVGGAFTAALAAPALAALFASDQHRTPPQPNIVPDGTQLMTLTIVGLVAVLAFLAAFVFRTTGNDLIDYRHLPHDESSRTVGELLGGGPGDPTEAIVSVVDSGSVEDNRRWAEAAMTLAGVAWIDTQELRYVAAEQRVVDPLVSLASETHIGARSPAIAIIVPSIPIRSPQGAALIGDLEALADDQVLLTGGAASLQRGSTALVVAVVMLLALGGAAAVMVETENLGQASTSFVLRLVGGAAAVGVYRLIAPESNAAETIAVLAVIALLVGMFELEFLHDRTRNTWSAHAGSVDVRSDGDPFDDRAEAAVDRTATFFAAVVIAFAGLWLAATRFFGGGPSIGRFGLALMLGLLIEILIGFVVLRPTLLGEKAVYHTVARPFRSTLHSGSHAVRSKPVSVDDPAWRRLIADLLIAEFGLQTDPAVSRLDQVFLDGTPLFRQVKEQHLNLTSAGLRVTGRAPQVRKIETFREGSSSVVSVTVDHPERHLVDGSGHVYGVRRPERRSSMLWLIAADPGRFRIAEAIELGSVPIDGNGSDQPSTYSEIAGVGG